MRRCTTCHIEFPLATYTGVCPRCGSNGLPMDPADDVTVKVNWHELRIMGVWAENHARTLSPDAQKALMAVLHRLEAQHPKKLPLSLAGEVAMAMRTKT